MKTTLSSIATAVKLILADLAKLQMPAIATAVAGVLAPVIFGIFGDNFPPTAIAGWLAVVGAVAQILQKITSGQVAAANARK